MDLYKEYEENVYILYQLSKCIEITSNEDILQKLYELKHFIIDEQEKIDDHFQYENEVKEVFNGIYV